MRTSSPSRKTSRRSSVLTGDFAWHSEERKVVKSCRPTSFCAAVVHGGAIERARHAPGAVVREREIGAAIDDAIQIMTLGRREARVEILRDLLRRQHRDRLRSQMKIDRIAHRVGVPFFAQIDMRHLAERVHAGIGASGAGNRDALAGKGRDRIGEDALHRGAVVLRLPADEGRAVIFDGELVAGQPAQPSTRGGRDRCAAQEFSARSSAAGRRAAVGECRTAPVAAGDRQLVVEHAARRPVADALRRAQNFHATGAGELAPRAGKGRQPAAMVMDFLPRLVPNRCASRSCRSCWRRSRPAVGCGVNLQRASFERGERAAA